MLSTVSMLRANRMKPSGSASRKKARSSVDSSGPAQPRIAARGRLIEETSPRCLSAPAEPRRSRPCGPSARRRREWACFSSSGPACTRYQTPRRRDRRAPPACAGLASCSPCALCRRAQVDLATSSFFTEATWMRQPPVGPDMFSIRLAMLGPLSVVVGALVAGCTVGRIGRRLAARWPACGAGCRRRGLQRRRRLGRARLGRLGRRRQPAGRWPAAWASPATGSSFSGWVGTAPGAMRLKTSLSWLGGTRPPAFSGLTRDGVVGACTTSGSSPRPPALTSWLCAHQTTEPKLATAATETITVRIWPRRRLTRMSSESRGGGGIESGSCATGRGGGSSRTATELVGPVDRWSVAGGGPANMHFLSHFIDGCYAEDL